MSCSWWHPCKCAGCCISSIVGIPSLNFSLQNWMYHAFLGHWLFCTNIHLRLEGSTYTIGAMQGFHLIAVKGLVESWHSPIDIDSHCMLEISFFVWFYFQTKPIHSGYKPLCQKSFMFRICWFVENRVHLAPKLCGVFPAFFSCGIICHYLVHLFDVSRRLSWFQHVPYIQKQLHWFQLHCLVCILPHLLQQIFNFLYHANSIFFWIVFGGLDAWLFIAVKKVV